MVEQFFERIKGQKINDVISVGSLCVEDSIAEMTPFDACFFLELDSLYLKLESIEQYSKLKMSFSEIIELDFDIEEDESFVKCSIAKIIFSDFLADNRIISIGIYNPMDSNGAVECAALEVKLDNGQELFFDPSYFGIQIGGEVIKYRWINTMRASGSEVTPIEFNL